MCGQGLPEASNLPGKCILLLLIILFMMGCSNSPDIPSAPESPDIHPVDSLPPSEGEAGSHMLWGYYAGHANADEGVFEMVPLRGAETHFNLVKLMNQTGGIATQIMWADSDLGQRRLNVRVIMVNPYATAPKFSGFDVRGILITGASHHFGNGLWTAGNYHPQLLNLDGLTRWWNPTEFTSGGYFGYVDGFLGDFSFGQYDARLNAFKMFADSLPEIDNELFAVNAPDLDADTGRGVFHNPYNTRRYDIKFPEGDSYFNYAIDVSWAEPSWPPEVPDDFPPWANRAEPWYVRGEIVYNTLEFSPGIGTTGFLDVYIYVADWQGRMLGAVAPQVLALNLYSDDLFGESVGHAELTFDNGKQAIYMAHLTSICNASGPGSYRIGIEVVSSQGSYKQGWPTAPGDQIAGYDFMWVDVEGTAPELKKVLGVHAYVLRKLDGTQPAVMDSEIQEDIKWANTFWTQYGFGFQLEKKTYIDSHLYYNLHPADADSLFNFMHDTSGLISVYYVNSIVGSTALAFASLPCYYNICTSGSTYVVFDGPAAKDYPAVLAHEFGHNVGMLEDEYNLDTATCPEVASWHGCPFPGDIYCNVNDAVDYNLMYWMQPPPSNPQDYWVSSTDIDMTTEVIDSQAENITYFHQTFPFNFKDVG